MTDREGAALREYMQKGGFVIVDDFKAERATSAVPAGSRSKRTCSGCCRAPGSSTMEPSHPIFHAFFEINSLDTFRRPTTPGQPIFRGVFEDNDPAKRLEMIINYNTDISQFWEWSGQGSGRSTRPTRPTSSASTTSSTA